MLAAYRDQIALHIGEPVGVMVYAGESEDVTGASPMRQPPRLLTEVRRRLRLEHYSLRTEQAYVAWIRRFILSNGKRYPRSMGATEVERFLSDLAVHGHVAGTFWVRARYPANSTDAHHRATALRAQAATRGAVRLRPDSRRRRRNWRR